MTTTLLLTEEVMREDRGAEGSYVLYGSSCAELTEEAEYVKKVFVKCCFVVLFPPLLGSTVSNRDSC